MKCLILILCRQLELKPAENKYTYVYTKKQQATESLFDSAYLFRTRGASGWAVFLLHQEYSPLAEN